jgi:hypothetical protein
MYQFKVTCPPCTNNAWARITQFDEAYPPAFLPDRTIKIRDVLAVRPPTRKSFIALLNVDSELQLSPRMCFHYHRIPRASDSVPCNAGGGKNGFPEGPQRRHGARPDGTCSPEFILQRF